jgi:VanZ family protein
MSVKRKLYIFLYIIWFLMIFAFSSQNGVVSSGTSKPLVDFILRFMQRFDQPLSVLFVTTVVRKSGHFMEYAVLGYVSSRNVDLNGSTLFYLSGLVPFLDEALQTQIAGRVGSLWDILIDLAGYGFGILIARSSKKRSAH